MLQGEHACCSTEIALHRPWMLHSTLDDAALAVTLAARSVSQPSLWRGQAARIAGLVCVQGLRLS